MATLCFALAPTLALAQIPRDDTGYNALVAQLGLPAMPTGAGVPVTQVEASLTTTDPNTMVITYYNRPTAALFPGKSFAFRSPFAQDSGHANTVGANFYGSGSSLAPGITTIDSYEAGNWLGISSGQGILRYNTAFDPRLSLNASRVVNHSWIFTGSSTAQALELLERNDWLIAKDDLIQVAGTNNGTGSINQALFSYGANTISVGLSNLNHGIGTPTDLNTNIVYGRVGTQQHPRPDLVAPAAATSFSTPLVSGAGALLVQASRDNVGWSTVTYDSPRMKDPDNPSLPYKIYAADTVEVIRAVLLAGADRTYFNSDGVKFLDYRATAGTQSLNGLDTRVGAGQLNVRNSYNILAGAQHVGAISGNGTAIPDAGFDYDIAFGGGSGSNTTATYQFTGGWTGQNFAASLVWNAKIDMTQVVPNIGFDPMTWTQNFDTAPTIYDFNLRLLDITDPGPGVEIAVSNGNRENTENIFTTNIVAGRQYQLEVSTPHTTELWDYGLAWNGISNQLWNGTGVNNTWDVAGAATWQRGTNTAATFLDHDQVVFNDTAANTTVNIDSPVAPAFVTVDNTTQSYVFNGAGFLTGSSGLIKQGTNSLTFNNVNNYTGDTVLRAGSLRAGATNTLSPNSAIDIAAGATLDLLGNANTVKQLSGSGTVQAGGATLGIATTGGATFTGTLVNPATLNKSLAGTQEFTGNVQWQATNINVQGGILRFALGNSSTVSLTAETNVAVQAGATLELAGTKSALSNGTLHAPIVTNAANAAVTVTGTNQVVGALTGPATGPQPLGSALGATTVATGANLTATRIRQTSLTINGTGKATIAANGGDSGVSQVTTLSISGTGQLDLKDNDLLVQNGNYTQLAALLANGANLNGSAWTGNGINSSVAAANPTLLSVGILLNDFSSVAGGNFGSGTIYSTFGGLPANLNDVLIKQTYAGDANLDGVINGTDFFLIDNGFFNNLNGWVNGDFDYNGIIDGTDYFLIDNAFANQGGPLLSFGGSSLLIAIPEPGTMFLAGFGTLLSVVWGVRQRRAKAA